MALILHCMALDAAASGTTLPDRSSSGADGTLSASCTWVNVGLPAEAAVLCPVGHKVSFADHARWDGLDEGIMLARFVMVGNFGTNPAWMAHSEGSGSTHKWAYHVNTDFSGEQQGIHVNNAGTNQFVRSGVQWNPLKSGKVAHSVALKRKLNAGNYDHKWYNTTSLIATTTGTQALPSVSASLTIGYGGESYFDGDIAMIAVRLYDDPDDLDDTGVLTALADDAAESLAAGGGIPGGGVAASVFGGLIVR